MGLGLRHLLGVSSVQGWHLIQSHNWYKVSCLGRWIQPAAAGQSDGVRVLEETEESLTLADLSGPVEGVFLEERELKKDTEEHRVLERTF